MRFLLLFGLLLGGFNAFFYLWLRNGTLFAAYLGLNAELTGVILRVLGDDITVRGLSIGSPRFSMSIRAGCDGIQASALFVLAVFLAPVSVSRVARVGPVVLGTLLLLVLNVVRIVSLYYTGIYFPNAFETMHVDVWQGVFIFLPIILWMIWSVWATRRTTSGADVST
ncbi:MAG: archaeosortase/exosortase family protein [Acidobacteria bacterium]|nr:archaeosortase/exosortase family protein [Acidobacteriota bacterium]